MMASFSTDGQNGQIPMVELKDGTKLVQTRAINNFISYKYGFTPDSAFKRYFGEVSKF